jgi:hypothetical protein
MAALKDRLVEMRRIAYDWHGGQSSPLYSFASTGKVWDEVHRERLKTELAGCLTESSADDEAELMRLVAYVESVVF